VGDPFYELIWHLPLSDFPLLREVAPFYFQWLEHPTYDDYWRSFSPIEHLEQIVTPALITTGWYDTMLGPSLELYRGMKERGGSEPARRPQLIVGPWWHGVWGSDFPERSFGERADRDVFDLTGRTMRWFDYHLKGIENGVPDDKPVQIFVMGPNVWRAEDDWPLPGTRFTHYYLHSGGRANTAHGDGVLSTDSPGDEREDVYLYNPRDPVPTLGGQAGLPPATMPQNAGPKDQRPLDARADVLTFVTPPLERDVEVTGPVELVLFVSSSAPDTDFTGKLVDVHPSGRAEILTDGILRARYRESFSAPQLLEPGRVYELRIDMWATSNVFAAGHRIRLDVASSNFPRFDRNTNTGNTIAGDREQDLQVAVNRVYHDRDHASHLILPIIERA
jgi:putative CocE/NonD family hydrolase